MQAMDVTGDRIYDRAVVGPNGYRSCRATFSQEAKL